VALDDWSLAEKHRPTDAAEVERAGRFRRPIETLDDDDKLMSRPL